MGPKVSSANKILSFYTSTNVGSQKNPFFKSGFVGLLPPNCKIPPYLSPSATCCSIVSLASALTRGPICIFSFMGSPTNTLANFYLSNLTNSGYISSATINLLAHKHTYPQLAILLLMASSAANSGSASLSTTNGSEPPNSMTLFFTYFPAVYATLAPTALDPVNETPYTMGLLIIKSV